MDELEIYPKAYREIWVAGYSAGTAPHLVPNPYTESDLVSRLSRGIWQAGREKGFEDAKKSRKVHRWAKEGAWGL